MEGLFAILLEGLLIEIQEEIHHFAVLGGGGGLRGAKIVNKHFVNKQAFPLCRAEFWVDFSSCFSKKFMCSPRNTGNINFPLWLIGGLSQGCPDFQKVYVFKVYGFFLALFFAKEEGPKKSTNKIPRQIHL